MKLFLSFWFFLCSVADLPWLSGAVLCFGRDGHVKLEASVNGRCGDAAEVIPAGSISMRFTVEDHCGECRDVPFFSEASRISKNRSLSASSLGLYPSASICLVSLKVSMDQGRLPLPCPPVLLELASLRTVRLLV